MLLKPSRSSNPAQQKLESEAMDTARDKILLSGASGMLGTALRTALVARGAEVLRLVRREPTSAGEIRWDPSAPSPLSAGDALEGLTAVIHLSGANVSERRWTETYRREMKASRVGSTHALATALAALERPPQALLVASATGIYGDRGEEVVDEDSPPGSGILAQLCKEWEASAEPARAAGLRVVSMRFSVVLSREGGALAKMLPLFRVGLGGTLGSGRQWMSWIGLSDLVAAVIFMLDTPTLNGPVNVSSPGPVTNAVFTRALARQLHRPALLPAPAFALRLAFGQMADEALLAGACVAPRKLLDAGFRFRRPTIEEALAAELS